MYRIRYRSSTVKIFQRMPSNVAKTVVGKINQLAENPYAPNNNITRLTGESGYRLRVGDWRVLSKSDMEMTLRAQSSEN